MAKKVPIKLKIYGVDYKENYILVNGHYWGNIKHRLVTDAKNIDKEVIKTNGSIYIDNPKEVGSLIPVKCDSFTSVSLSDYSFIIKQGIVDDRIESAILYTECLDQDKLFQLSEYSNKMKIKDKDIKVLQMK